MTGFQFGPGQAPYYLSNDPYQLRDPSPWRGQLERPADDTSYNGMAGAGLALSAGGAALQAIGTYQSLMGQRHQQRSEALNDEFRATQSAIVARAAEGQAQQILRASKLESAFRGLVEAQDIGQTRADAAARGVVVGKGSAGDIERSQRLAAELDKRTLRTNGERAAANARKGKANAAAESLLSRASAANRRATASGINPALGAAGGALGSAGSLLAQYNSYYGRR